MKALIAISSCERDAKSGAEQAMRDTWLKVLPSGFEFRFFRGIPSWACGATMEGNVPCLNEKDQCSGHQFTGNFFNLEWFPVKDDYHSLPLKTRESCRWAVNHGFDFVFRAFTDTCVHPDRLLNSGFEQHDYFGHFPAGYCSAPDAKGNFCYASGGPGYWLSRHACEAVVNSEPDHWAEDLWVGNVMGRNGILGTHDERFFFKWGRPRRDTISVHLSRGTGNYQPQWMRDCFYQLMNS